MIGDNFGKGLADEIYAIKHLLIELIKRTENQDLIGIVKTKDHPEIDGAVVSVLEQIEPQVLK